MRLGLFVATCGYLGYVPIAPGTFGSAAGLIAFAAVRWSGSTAIEIALIVLLLVIGVWSGNVAEKHFGGVDPAPVILDEVAGMLITLAFIPVNLTGAIVGFFLFRLFDVIKPWPANRCEALPGGLGRDGGRRDGGGIRQSGLAPARGGDARGMAFVKPAHAARARRSGRVRRDVPRMNSHGRPIVSAAIIAVGSELLTPSKIDTNSLFITEQLNLLGIDVKMKAVAG